MAIKPITLSDIGKKVLPTVAQLPLKAAIRGNEPAIPPPNFPLVVPSSIANLITPAGGLKPQGNALIARALLDSIVMRGDKPYMRMPDSRFSAIKKIPIDAMGKDFSKLTQGKKDALTIYHKPFFGRAFTKTDPLIDTAPLKSLGPAIAQSALVGTAAQHVGVPITRPVVVTGSHSPMFSTPSGIVGTRGDITLNAPLITTPLHELSHAKDFQMNPWKKYLPVAGQALGYAGLLGTPVSILYGKELSKAIPGSVDDKIINAVKYFGPEMYLAGAAMQTYPELYATKNTKKLLGENKNFYGAMTGALGSNSSIEDLQRIQDLKAKTYLSGHLGAYGLLRLGTLPLYMGKESSLKVQPPTMADYARAVKNQIMQVPQAFKGVWQGVSDPNVVKSMLYHDSANKYKPISDVTSLPMLLSLLPILATSIYLNGEKKPSVVPSGTNDVLKGLGA